MPEQPVSPLSAAPAAMPAAAPASAPLPGQGFAPATTPVMPASPVAPSVAAPAPFPAPSAVPAVPAVAVSPVAIPVPAAPAPVAAPTAYSVPMAAPAHGSVLPIVLAAGAAVLVVGGIGAWALLGNRAISSADYSKAISAEETFTSNINDAALDAEDLAMAKSDAEADSKFTDFSSKLSSAQAEYKQFKGLAVMRDKVVKSSFQALDSRWQPFVAYITDAASDQRVFAPTFNEYEQQDSTLNQTYTSTLSLMQGEQANVSATLAKVQNMKMKLAPNQSTLTAFVQFLGQANADLAAAIAAKSKGDYTGELGALNKLDDAQSAYNKTAEANLSQVETDYNQVNIETQVNALADSLDKLGKTLK